MSLRSLNGEASLLRIYCGDSDVYRHHPLDRALVEKARKEGLAGCTAFAGFWSYGSRGFIHTDLAIEGAGERAALIEIVDYPGRVGSFALEIIPLLSKAGGMVTEETVFVRHYQHGRAEKGAPMDRQLDGESILLRVFIGESDKFEGKPLFEAILERVKELGAAGCTVIRAVAGFGASSVIHKGHAFSLSQDNPMLIEVVETPERVRELLAEIHPMLQGALVTEEKVRVLHRSAGQRG